jgi:phospholipid transport system substrate-binding protein
MGVRSPSLALVSLVALMLGVSGARAQSGPTGTPEPILRSALDRALAVLRDPTLQAPDRRDERRQKLRDISNEVFDWTDMARRSLGVAWRRASADQRKRFISAFREILANRYLSDIDSSRGDEKYTIDSVQGIPGGGYRIDTTLITHSQEHIKVSYFFGRTNGGWTAHDLSIEEVDMVEHYRTVFSHMLVNGSLEQLIQTLERKKAEIG